jgi:ABC-type Fe3+-hydroxamate transport system substrate-binding protein
MELKDDLGRLVKLSKTPQRIVSLVPSITEFLIDIGLEKALVGRTQFCIHPQDIVVNIPAVGGTKNVDIDKVIALQPDLIIAVKEENEKSQIEQLCKEAPCLIFDVVDLSSALNMMETIAKATQKEQKVNAIIEMVKEAVCNLNKKGERMAMYLIWHKPMMTINKNTYISEMMKYAGFANVFASKQEAYPVIEDDEVLELNPEYILLSSEPFNFTEKHKEIYRNKFPNSKVILVDGEMFSWYGSRMIKAFKYFSNLI